MINEALPFILRICKSQLNLPGSTPKNFISMVVYTLSMAFWYNSALTFKILDQQLNQTTPVLQAILSSLPKMKHDFELRRMIFGLTAIISTPPQALPA